MNVENMRYIIKQAYQGDKWKDKVDKMSDNQVVAVYYKFIENGKIK